MKYKLIFFFGLLFAMGNAQSAVLDFSKIKKELNDPKSMYFYDKILYKYKGLPKALDQDEAQYLYYGRNYKGTLVSTGDKEFTKMVEVFKQKNANETIQQCLQLLTKDPTNLDVLMVIIQAYQMAGDEGNFIFRLGQFRAMIEAVRSSGDGKSEASAYLVNSVGDEYILLSVLNIDLNVYKRQSKIGKSGMFDIWTNGNEKIFVKVLYADD